MGVVQGVEAGRPALLETYTRIGDALNLQLDIELSDPRRRQHSVRGEADLVHAAMGELEAAQVSKQGFAVGIDEPYQHYQFAGRADLVAWDVGSRALLHIENRTRFPDVQEAAGAWNAKRAYLPAAMRARLEISSWLSVTHVMVVLWSAEALHTLRLRATTFRALCPDTNAGFDGWWSGSPPRSSSSAALVLLDPCAVGRQRVLCSFEDALRVKPRHRGYAEVAERLRQLSVRA